MPRPKLLFFVEGFTDIRFVTGLAGIAELSLCVPEGHYRSSGLRERVIAPIGEARSDYLIFAALAERLGYGDRYPQSEQNLLEFAFGGESPVDLETLRAHPEGVQVPQPAMVYRKYEQGLLRKDGAMIAGTAALEVGGRVLVGVGLLAGVFEVNVNVERDERVDVDRRSCPARTGPGISGHQC